MQRISAAADGRLEFHISSFCGKAVASLAPWPVAVAAVRACRTHCSVPEGRPKKKFAGIVHIRHGTECRMTWAQRKFDHGMTPWLHPLFSSLYHLHDYYPCHQQDHHEKDWTQMQVFSGIPLSSIATWALGNWDVVSTMYLRGGLYQSSIPLFPFYLPLFKLFNSRGSPQIVLLGISRHEMKNVQDCMGLRVEHGWTLSP